MRHLFSCVMLVLALVWPTLSFAGSSNQAGHPHLPADDVAAFANRVQQELAARKAHVAIVSRIGRPPAELPDGVKYTHVSYWVYSNITDADGRRGRGYRVYNLYQDQERPTRSTLVQDSPADFFAGAYLLDAGVIIPDVRLQKKLLKVIASPTYTRLHNAKYSVLSNPNTQRFQNCTEHTLDVLFASLYGTEDLAQIKANISAHFEPQEIRISGLKRVFAPVTSQALTTSDHGNQIATATFGSIARFMKSHKLSAQTLRITPSKVMRY